MLPPQGSRKLDQRRFKFVIIPRPHFFRTADSRKEIADAAQMMTNRVVSDIAGGCHTCKFDDLRKYSIDVCLSIEFFAPPSAREIPPLRQCPSGVADLAEWSVIFIGVSRSYPA